MYRRLITKTKRPYISRQKLTFTQHNSVRSEAVFVVRVALVRRNILYNNKCRISTFTETPQGTPRCNKAPTKKPSAEPIISMTQQKIYNRGII